MSTLLWRQAESTCTSNSNSNWPMRSNCCWQLQLGFCCLSTWLEMLITGCAGASGLSQWSSVPKQTLQLGQSCSCGRARGSPDLTSVRERTKTRKLTLTGPESGQAAYFRPILTSLCLQNRRMAPVQNFFEPLSMMQHQICSPGVIQSAAIWFALWSLFMCSCQSEPIYSPD